MLHKLQKKIIKITLSLIIAVIFTNCSKQQKQFNDYITIFCGSANKPAVEKISKLFEKEKKIQTRVIYGGSGTLLAQIMMSQKGEIYLPGSPDFIIIGNKKNLLMENTSQMISYLIPGIIVPEGNPANIQKLEDLAKENVTVGIGNPETVCLGLYGIEILEKAGLLNDVFKNIKTFGSSCSKTANLAAMNSVDAILGWRVLQFWNAKKMDYIPIDPKKIPRLPCIYISIPVFTKNIELSKLFIDFILSEKSIDIYRQYGYITEENKALKFAPEARIGGQYKLPGKYFDIIKRSSKIN